MDGADARDPSVASDELIVFDDVGKTFSRADGDVQALHGLSFSVRRGEMVAIVGQTGCGKSTAFNLLLGLFAPTTGSVSVEGHDPAAEFEWFKGRVAVVFQDDRLLPWRTTQDNVALGLEYQGVGRNERRRIAREWLGRLGLAGQEHAYPYQLSGGMRQRVGIARCFAMDPDIILCDESFSALDELTAEDLREEFRGLVKAEHKTGVFITHSIEEALTLGDRVLVFRAPGHVAADIPVPADLDVQRLAEHRDLVRRAMSGDANEAVQS